jgi:hypothetical protein
MDLGRVFKMIGDAVLRKWGVGGLFRQSTRLAVKDTKLPDD